MRKSFLLLFLLATTIQFVVAQTNAFSGYWSTPETGIGMVVYGNDEKPRVFAWDESDGETLQITDVLISGNKMAFTMLTPSTNWVVKSTFKLIDNNTLEKTLVNENGTYTYNCYKRDPDFEKKTQNIATSPIYLGCWQSDGTQANVVFYLDKDGSVQVKVWDKSDGEELTTSNLVVQPRNIHVDTFTKTTNWQVKSDYRIVNRNTLEETLVNNDGKVKLTFTRVE